MRHERRSPFWAPMRIEALLRGYAPSDEWDLWDAPSLQQPIGAWVRDGMPSVPNVGPKTERELLGVGAPLFDGHPWAPEPEDRLADVVLHAISAWGGLEPLPDRCPHCGGILP